jgi:hypothetical protein
VSAKTIAGRVLLDDAYEEDDADHGDDVQFVVQHPQGQQGTQALSSRRIACGRLHDGTP